jgi:hypothetical protein
MYKVDLYAVAEPEKYERASVKWLARYAAEASPSLLDCQIAPAALAEFSSGGEPAKALLLELAGKRRDAT